MIAARRYNSRMAKRESCHLCGTNEVQLTKDHIQPQCAFNEKNRRHVRLDSPLELSTLQRPAPYGKAWREIYYEIQPDRPIAGGIYRRTQCEQCNGLLGEYYDAHLGQFCHDAVANLKLGNIHIVQKTYRQTIRYPLSLLKRILAMFFSINGSNFVHAQPELSKFIREPENRELPPRFHVFVGYNTNDMVSHIPYQVRARIGTGIHCQFSQIAHPPFVYLLAIDSPRPDSRLVEFTRFTQYAYGEEANIEEEFVVMPTNNCFAGDFRREGKVIPDGDAILTPEEVRPTYFRLIDPVI